MVELAGGPEALAPRNRPLERHPSHQNTADAGLRWFSSFPGNGFDRVFAC
jgi:hypothetical protein